MLPGEARAAASSFSLEISTTRRQRALAALDLDAIQHAVIKSFATGSPPVTVTAEQMTLEDLGDSRVRVTIVQAEGGPAAEAITASAKQPTFLESVATELSGPFEAPWRGLPLHLGRAERRRRAAQATTSAPPTGGAAAAAPTAPPSAVARRLSSGRRQVPRAEGATGPADARPAEPSSSMAGRAPPRRFSAHWRAEEAAGVAAGIGGGASSVLGSEADFERRSIDLRAGRWVALGHRRRRGGRRRPEERLGRVAHMLPAK
mmetsp:Transcript_42453/g.136841  ORF Transcript_42453/g.136841 Transcript_42453/m.136841 type:complete len:261 (+) Transcript_42453:255-1037(+)